MVYNSDESRRHVDDLALLMAEVSRREPVQSQDRSRVRTSPESGPVQSQDQSRVRSGPILKPKMGLRNQVFPVSVGIRSEPVPGVRVRVRVRGLGLGG